MRRFTVSGHSMLPTIKPGEEVVVTSKRKPGQGDIVAFPHPGDSDIWLIKRLADEAGTVVSDNTDDSALDSLDLGPIDIATMMPVVERLDATTFAEACAFLAEEDRALAGLVDQFGIPAFWHRTEGFPTLVLLILEQQVSLESGAAMYRRLTESLGIVSPRTVLEAGDTALRSIGVTRQKAAYLLGLADAVVTGDIDLAALDEMGTDAARVALTRLKGIGAWTADAYLLSAQRRPDMWPVGDRALQVGTAEALGMTEVPDEGELEIIAEPWRPIRAVAARLIWNSYLERRGRVEPPDPT